MSDGSNAPKERINISYKAKTNGVSADVELPLKLMVMSNFTGDTNKIPLEEREPVSINKVNFNKVMEQMGITADFTVKNPPIHLHTHQPQPPPYPSGLRL